MTDPGFATKVVENGEADAGAKRTDVTEELDNWDENAEDWDEAEPDGKGTEEDAKKRVD